MIDRKDYLSGKVSHREWYAQFVTSETINRVSLIIGKDRIKASIDPYFNDIPLYEWDAIVKTYGVTSRIREWRLHSQGSCPADTRKALNPKHRKQALALVFLVQGSKPWREKVMDILVDKRKGDRFTGITPVSVAAKSLFRSNRMEDSGETLMEAHYAMRFLAFAIGRGLKVQTK